MHGSIAALLLLLAFPAAAEVSPDGYIIRCTRGKQVSIQNVPCEPGWKQQGETSAYYAPIETERARRELKATQAEVARRNARMHQARGSSESGASYTWQDCQNARQRRDRARQQIGSLRLTPERERALCLDEARVCGSCRPVPQEGPMFDARPPIRVSTPAPASSSSVTHP